MGQDSTRDGYAEVSVQDLPNQVFSLFLLAASLPARLAFGDAVEDHGLEGPALFATKVPNEEECQYQCIMSQQCSRYNFGHAQDASRHHICEILYHDFHSYKVQKRPGFHFRTQKVSKLMNLQA